MQKSLFSFAGVSNSGLDVLIIVMFLIATLAVMLIAAYLITKFIYKPKEESGSPAVEANTTKKQSFSYAGMFWAIIAIGFIIRLIFVFAIKGYRDEFNIFTTLINKTKTDGIDSYYTNKSISVYPIVVYLYSFMGNIARFFQVTASDSMMPFFIKLPFIICDLVASGVVYLAAKKYINNQSALVLSALTALFPAFIFASSVWGSVYSLYLLLSVLCFYFIATKNFVALIGVYSLALLTIEDALYLFPVISVFVIYSYIKYCIAFAKSENRAFGEMIKDKDSRNIILIPAAIIFFGIISYLITLPLIITNIGASFFGWMNMIYFFPLSDIHIFGHNALNLFNLFLQNGDSLPANFPSAVFSSLFAVIVFALVLLVYLSRKNRANLSFLAAFIMLTLSIFFMGFSELNLIPAIMLFILSFVLIKDKRILHVVGLLGFSVVFNASTVMALAGYLNNLIDADITTTNPSYVGTTILNSGGGMAISIICSVIAILTFVYATIILLDLSMSNKRKLFKNIENPSFFGSIKNFIK